MTPDIVIEQVTFPANKDKKNNLPIGISTNKSLYLVVVEDQTTKDKKRAFISSGAPDFVPPGIKIQGFEISYTNRENIRTHADVHQYIMGDLLEIMYPLNRVINVRNISYKTKEKNDR